MDAFPYGPRPLGVGAIMGQLRPIENLIDENLSDIFPTTTLLT